MEPRLFPECVICQVRAFGCTLRRPSLFCVCLAIPATAACPRPLLHINIQLSHRMQRDRQTCTSFRGKPCTPSPPSQIQLTGSSRSRWAVEIKPLGTRQQLCAAYCEIWRSYRGSRLNRWGKPRPLYVNAFLLTISFSFVRDIDRYSKVLGQHLLKH